MKDKTITSMSLGEAILRKDKTKIDWPRLRRERAAGVEPAGEVAEGEFDWAKASVVMLPATSAISLRLDTDVLAFFKAQGRGYQTRINAVLRSYMEAQQGEAPVRR